MALAAGSRLGPYEIVSSLGAGGMGEVYRARDTRLNRTVAIKLLPTDFARDPAARERFDREARAISHIDHSNICALYDIGTHEDAPYLVMQYVDGETLAARIARGAVPVDEAIAIARQIADALDAAHARGIVHRDLKPGNVMLAARDNSSAPPAVKVLDFGLAKDTNAQAAADASMSPTMLSATSGIILGTAAYMSPEQARGRPVDKRADIWAFGAVLYEMMTGWPPFTGETVTDVIAAVVKNNPDWTRLPPTTPTAIRRLLVRCLQKDPSKRLRDIGDACLELDDPSSEVVAAPMPRWSAQSRIAWLLTALALTLAAFAVIFWRTPAPSSSIGWHGEVLGGPPVAMLPRVSPSGDMVAFVAMVDGITQVAIMRPSSGHWTILTSDRTRGNIHEPAWSHDGSTVYFDRVASAPRGVFRISVLGSEPRLVLDNAMTPRPLPDGSLLVVRINDNRQRQLFRFWPESGRQQPLNAVIGNVLQPPLLVIPGGREALFFGRPLNQADSLDQLYAINLASGALRIVADAASIGIYRWTVPFAVTVDGRDVLVDIPAGNIHRIVAIALDGSGRRRTLIELTGRPLAIDSGPDGSLYADLIYQPEEILSGRSGSEPLARERISNLSETGPHALRLPDGRILSATRIGGRQRVMAFGSGVPTPLLETQEESSAPMAMVGQDQVALLIGSHPRPILVVASIPDGRIVQRLGKVDGQAIDSIVGSPDGRTLYYGSRGVIWALDLETQATRPVRAGDSAAIDARTSTLLVAVTDTSGIRIVRVPFTGESEQHIPFPRDLALASPDTLTPAAVAPDGRIAVRYSGGSWFWRTAILDPRTGRAEIAWPSIDADMQVAGWTDDGQLVVRASFINASLWRFTPVGDSNTNGPR